jgi:hypothetical protein
VSDIECLEKVQQRAVNMVSGLTGASYKEKLQEVYLLLLEERHHQADMHLMHKIMHGDGGLEANAWLERASSAAHTTRGGANPFNVKVKSEEEFLQYESNNGMKSDTNRNKKQTRHILFQGGI